MGHIRLNCLVTGGAGFIGSILVDRLIQCNYNVVVIDNESAEQNEKFYWSKKAKNFKYNICEFNKIEKLFEGIDCVFHLAAQSRIEPSILNPSLTIKTNCFGTENILKACKRYKIKKIVFSSSSAIYGLNNPLPNKENMNRDCLNPYALSKAVAEDLCNMYSALHGLEIIILRYFSVYGERQPTKSKFSPIVGRFLKLKKKGKPLTIVGDGKQRRDFIHVYDVVLANILAARNKTLNGLHVFNIGFGKNHSVLSLAKILSTKIVYIENRRGEAFETLADIRNAKKYLKWFPKIDIENWIKGLA